jgi:hypothetical protein
MGALLDRPSSRAAIALAVVLAAAAFGLLDVRQRARLDRGLSRHHTDVTVYLAAARAMRDGDDPYEARGPRGWRYVYPPLLALLLEPLVGLEAPDAALVVYALSVLAGFGAWRWIRSAVGPPGGTRAALWAFVVASPFLVQTLQRGQVTIFLLAAQAGALVLLRRGRDVVAGIVLGLATALRLTPLLAAGMVVLGGRSLRFPLGLAAGLAIGFAVLPVAVLGPERALDVTTSWARTTAEVFGGAPGKESDLSRDAIDEFSYKNQSVRRVSSAWLLGSEDDGAAPTPPEMRGPDLVALGVGIAALLLGAGLGLGGPRDRGSARFRRVFSLGALLPVFVTRYAWPIHYVLAVPFLAECRGGEERPWRRGAFLVFAAAVVLFCLGHLPALRVLPRYGVLLLGTAAAVVLLLRPTAGRMTPLRTGQPTPANGSPGGMRRRAGDDDS